MKPRFHQRESASLSKINLSPLGLRKNKGCYFLIIINMYPYITHNKKIVKHLRFWRNSFRSVIFHEVKFDIIRVRPRT